MNKKKINPKDIFQQYFPTAAVDYCFNLWKTYNFSFHIKKSRLTKLGDYRFHPGLNTHTITVNADLNPHAFLITYLHEIAHLVIQLTLGNQAEPHGSEWKKAFKNLAKPLLHTHVFPPDVLIAFESYLKNPKATSCSDIPLMRALLQQDTSSDVCLLSDVGIGKLFDLNGKIYTKEQNRRTRSICRELATGKKYLISKAARVKTNCVAETKSTEVCKKDQSNQINYE